jgi:hypothetical protein
MLGTEELKQGAPHFEYQNSDRKDYFTVPYKNSH